MSQHKTSYLQSTLIAKSLPGQRDKLLATFFKYRVFEECKKAVPGFLSGEVLLSLLDTDELMVSVKWCDKAAWQAWQESPVRLQQSQVLAPFLAGVPIGQLYELATQTHAPEP